MKTRISLLAQILSAKALILVVALSMASALSGCPDEPSATQPDTVTPQTDTTNTDGTTGPSDATTDGVDATADTGPPATLCTTDAECVAEPGTVCACTGRCVAVSTNPCNSDINCAPGDYCDACTGHCGTRSKLCESCTGLGSCADGGSCLPFTDGGTYCSQACISDAGCPTGYTCSDIGATDKQCLPKSGDCQDLGLCADDGECPDGEICNDALKVCAPGCKEDGECPNNQVCVASRCSEPCTENTDCESPKECIDSRCKVPGACDSSAECLEAETYCNKSSGMCVSGCLQDVHCGDAAKECKNGTCVSKGCTHNYQCSFEEECNKTTAECVPMAKDHCAACDAQAEGECGGDPNLCVSFQDEDEQPLGDFCLLTCEDDEIDQCPQGYACQQIEGDGVSGFYCVRQCYQTPVGVN